ncbi:hypothetical protein LTR53_011728, partial [Teratosphaeriaceae sp. CCFEE 6253]
MSVMAELMQVAQERGGVMPGEALEVWAQQQQQLSLNEGGGGPAMMGGGGGGGRTPSMGHMALGPGAAFSSPGMANMMLPQQQHHLPNGLPGSSPQQMSHALAPGQQQHLQQQLAPPLPLPQPGSHTPSPRQPAMAAPSMMPQHSQQGGGGGGGGTTS